MGQLENLIEKCNAALTGGPVTFEEACDIARCYELAYKKQVHELTGKVVRTFVQEGDSPEDLGLIVYFILMQLNAYKEDREFKLAVAQAGAASNTATSKAEASTVVQVTMAQAMDKVDACDIPSDELRDIKAALKDLEASKTPETVCDKASKLLDLVKKGADTATAVAPYVASALAALGAGAQ